MAVFSAIVAGVALAATVAGTVVQMQGQKKAQDAADQQIAIQRRQEELRKRQMQLEAARKRREIIRNMIIARSTSLANTVNAGANFGSALPGAIGGIESMAGGQIRATNQNESIGLQMFDTNMDLFNAQAAGASALGTQQLGGSLTSLGGALVQQQGGIERIGTTLFPSANTTGWTTTVTRA